MDPRDYARRMARQDDLWRNEVLDAIPGYEIAYNKFGANLPHWTSALSRSPRRSMIRVGFQATNDYIDLIQQCTGGNGRSGVRTARSLFELLVTACDLHLDPTLDERYLDHEVITQAAASQIDWGTDRLLGNERRQATHFFKKAYRNAVARASTTVGKHAIDQRTKNYRRQWHPDNLEMRSRVHALDNQYNFYRLSSAVVHGSSAGNIGLLLAEREPPVHRTGPALGLCPVALLHGNRFFRGVVDTLEADGVGPIPAGFREGLDLFDAHWPEFWRWARDADAGLWPEEEHIVNVLTVLEVFPPPGNKRVWHSYSVANQRIVEADAPVLSPEESRRIDEVIAEAEAPNRGRTQPFTLAVTHIHVSPKAGARWRPAGDVLNQRPLTVAEGPYLRTTEKFERDPRLFR